MWGPPKRCLPFSDWPKYFENLDCFFFFFFFSFFYIQFAFLNKTVKIKVSKYIVTVPNVYCVGTEGICLPHTCLHQIVWCHLFKYRKLYMHFSNIQMLGGKKKINLPTLPIFRPKANKPLSFLGLLWLFSVCRSHNKLLPKQMIYGSVISITSPTAAN